MAVVFDTSAWIEYFQGTKKGKIAEECLLSDRVITSILSLFEIACKCERDGENPKPQLDFIVSKSEIAGLDLDPVKVGKILKGMRERYKSAGLIDAVILETAKEYKARLLTKDFHFSGFEEAVII